MATAIAVLTALLAACCFGVAAVVQQATASSMPEAQSLRPRLLWALAHRPLWLVGIGMSVASYFIQGVALAFGSLVLVMPLASTDLLFALRGPRQNSQMKHRLRESPCAVKTFTGSAVGDRFAG